MIEKVSDILSSFLEIEKEKLRGFDMPHMPTLGAAYEEITKQGIDNEYIIPKDLNLNMVSGFISLGSRVLPQQIDAMLVHGNGVRYGLTNSYYYPVEQVLCIFEVKKTLNKPDLVDAFDHLREIRKEYSNYFEEKLSAGGFEPSIAKARKHFSELTGKSAPERYLDIHYLSKADGILFYTLVQEVLAPVSIIHGYGGYKTESGLRNAFLDCISDKGKINRTGLGVSSLPNLITSNNFSLVKANGMPFLGQTYKREWAVLLSTRYNPVRMMLEIIWSKISVFMNQKMPWGDDLLQETVTPLMLAIPRENETSAGWEYIPLRYTEDMLAGRCVMEPWKPTRVGCEIVTAFSLMSAYGGVLDESTLIYISEKCSIGLDDLKSRIVETMFFAFDDYYNCYNPINSETYLHTNDDDTGYLSSDGERLSKWCINNGIKPCVIAFFQ